MFLPIHFWSRTILSGAEETRRVEKADTKRVRKFELLTFLVFLTSLSLLNLIGFSGKSKEKFPCFRKIFEKVFVTNTSQIQ